MHDRTQGEPRLLAIDDSALIHRLLRARLKHEGIEIHGAVSAADGLEAARVLLPEVILLDAELPETNGFEVLQHLKADPQTHDIPVILLSSSAESADKVHGLEMGAHDFVTKPFDIVELRARVRSALRIRQLIVMLAQRAQVDGLTGLWNRSYFNRRLEEELAEALRYGTELSLIMCDIDHFKRVNDTYGHPVGDRILRGLAALLGEGRGSDVPCRYGGEEFMIILPHTAMEEAYAFGERLREAIRRMRWQGHGDLVITASFGVADLTCVDEPTVQAVVTAVDRAMYAAKQAGRDQVQTAQSSDPRLRQSA